MSLSRRSILGGLAALLAAPAIIRVAGIMPISVQPPLAVMSFRIKGTDAAGLPIVELYEVHPALVEFHRARNMVVTDLHEAYRNLASRNLAGMFPG